MDDPGPAFANLIDIDQSRIKSFPRHIFMCGGPVVDAGSPPKSVRDFILREIALSDPALSGEIVLAETINDWMLDGVYGDLFEFEQDLAELASVIVIFVESAGSVAELGAFSLLAGVNEKLLVFLRSSHYADKSFIRLGPVKFLEDKYPRAINVYPWLARFVGSEDVIDEPSVRLCRDGIVDEIRRAAKSSVPRNFERGRRRDHMLLMCDFVDLLVGLQLAEIQGLLKLVGLDLEVAQLKRYLFVLEKLGLVTVVPRGHRKFYVASAPRNPIEYAFRAGAPPYDRIRLRGLAAEFYRNEDRERHRAVSAVLARTAVPT